LTMTESPNSPNANAPTTPSGRSGLPSDLVFQDRCGEAAVLAMLGIGRPTVACPAADDRGPDQPPAVTTDSFRPAAAGLS